MLKPFFRIHNSVRGKLFFSFISLILLLSFLLSLGAYFISYSFVKKRVSESFSITLDYVSASVSNELENLYRLMDYIFVSKEIKSAILAGPGMTEASFHANSAALDILSQYSFSHMLDDINCVTINGYNGYNLTYALDYTDLAAEGLFNSYEEYREDTTAMNGKIMCCGLQERLLHPTHQNSVGFRDIIFSRSLKDNSYQEDIGILCVSVNPRVFYRLIQQYNSSFPNYANECKVLILDNYNNVINPEDSTLSNSQIEAVLKDTQAARRGVTLKEADSIIYVKPIENSGWHIIAMIPHSMLMADQFYIVFMSILAFALSFIVCALIFAYQSRSVFQPLSKMGKIVQKIGGGETQLRLPVESNDEIGQLGEQVNLMLEQIKLLHEQNLQSELKMRDAMYRAKQSQINPHFIYNTLNSIRWMAVMIKADNIKSAIDAFWQIAKYNTNVNEYYVAVEQELNIVKQYAYLQSLCYVNKFKITWDVSDEVLSCKCLKFILQPMIENAIIHGVYPKNEAGNIYVSIYGEDGQLIFNIYDDGVGMNEAALEELKHGKQGHIGISNVLERLYLAYGQEYAVDISSEPGSYTNIMIRTPLLPMPPEQKEDGV